MRSSMLVLLAGLAVIGAAALAGCSNAPTTAPTATAVPSATPTPGLSIVDPAGLGPAETVSAFYTWYLGYSRDGQGGVRNPVVSGAYRDTGYVTDAFDAKVRAAMASPGGGFDPFLCAQDIPEQILPTAVTELDDGRVEVQVSSSFAGHQFALRLARAGDVWKIDEILCSGSSESGQPVVNLGDSAAGDDGAPSEIADGWRLYRMEEFRFQIGYPDGWVLREYTSAPGEPPIGPAELKLVVMFMPADWAEQLDRPGPPDPNAPVLAPLTLEVILGSEEAFWGNYPEPAESTPASLANAEALYTLEEVAEDITIPRYVFRHPITADLRVVLTDPISGFADRLEAHPEVAAAFRQMADGFAWLD